MIFSSILFVIAAQAVLTTVGQVSIPPVGRYLYKDKNQGYTIAFDINENKKVGIIFVMGEESLEDGMFPLDERARQTYDIDFKSSPSGVQYWYDRIRAILPTFKPVSGDLTSVIFTNGDSPFVMFEGERLDLTREGLDARDDKSKALMYTSYKLEPASKVKELHEYVKENFEKSYEEFFYLATWIALSILYSHRPWDIVFYYDFLTCDLAIIHVKRDGRSVADKSMNLQGDARDFGFQGKKQ
ncbi:hypothetical protein FOL47_005569 [Perkinsus chesapeaki]|uniref:Uncharacterized protein n=1 Tax=Perkinsus chesapeaki TaxID=330153 RepID=A0A7J6LWS3_PERCH|nr:hypothetical protein FOL47_005569 [Perkinsus chesapeaki]